MWLINAQTLKLEEFIPPVTTPYAILSHTWGDDEVSFADMKNLDEASSRTGFAKIAATCRRALLDGHQYAWVDTCCIDKSSSAELSEAINSMFSWYQASVLCYAYISGPVTIDTHTPSGRRDFASCRWFTRGWTLQELIAPREVHFYDSQWGFIGTKRSLGPLLSEITLIDPDVLSGRRLLKNVLAANKMAWASQRLTTRVEDMAYCLFGLFDIHLPIVYGEGAKAFMRLQEEIFKFSMDLTLLAWTDIDPFSSQQYRGIFARSPKEFSKCRGFTSQKHQFHFGGRLDITNLGVHITGISLFQSYAKTTELILPLLCHDPDYHHHYGPHKTSGENSQESGAEVGILLQRTMRGYVRIQSYRLHDAGPVYNVDIPGGRVVRDFYALPNVDGDLCTELWSGAEAFIEVEVTKVSETDVVKNIQVREVFPSALWGPSERRFFTAGLSTFSGLIVMTGFSTDEWPCMISFGFDNSKQPAWSGCFVQTLTKERYDGLKRCVDWFGEHYALSLWTRDQKRYSARSEALWAGGELKLTARMAPGGGYVGGPPIPSRPTRFKLSIIIEQPT